MSPRTSLAGSRAADLEQANLPLGLIGALALHVLILGAMMFTWTHTLDIADQSPIVPIDLVSLSDKTNVKAMVKVETKAPPKEEQIAPPTPQPAPQPTPQPQQQEEEAAPPPDLSTVPVPKKPPPPQTQKNKPEADKKSLAQNFDDLLANIDKRTPAPSSTPRAQPSSRNVKGFGAQDQMTADLQSALASQIKPCWSPPVGAPNAQDLVVDFDLLLNRDGSIAQAPQLVGNSAAAAASNPYTRAAAEAARRAIYTCAPYKLPPERYSQWSEINPFHFDPRVMMGQ